MGSKPSKEKAPFIHLFCSPLPPHYDPCLTAKKLREEDVTVLGQSKKELIAFLLDFHQLQPAIPDKSAIVRSVGLLVVANDHKES